MSSERRLVIATHNPGKLRELASLLEPLGHALVAAGALGIDEPDEPHPTFVENALAKARHASAQSGLPALADDSGLCVDALDGRPGVRSARFAADPNGGKPARDEQDRRNNAALVAALAGIARREARYVCALVLVRTPDDPEPLVATGRLDGRIVDVPRGANGFGYDAHFEVASLGRTAAELDPATKNRIGHRGIALRLLAASLAERDRPA